MRFYKESAIELAAIFGGAAVEVAKDTAHWVGGLVARADAWLCDYGDEL